MGENGGSGRAVAAGIVGLGGGFFDQLDAHILERVGEFDFFGNGNAVIDDAMGLPISYPERPAVPLGPRVTLTASAKGIDTFFQVMSNIFTEYYLFCHFTSPYV